MVLLRKHIKPIIILLSITLIFACASFISRVCAADYDTTFSVAAQEGPSADDEENGSSDKEQSDKQTEDAEDDQREDQETGDQSGETGSESAGSGELSDGNGQNSTGNGQNSGNKAAAATVEIEDAETPLAGGIWALTNMVLCILTMLGAVAEWFIPQKNKIDDEEWDELESDESRAERIELLKTGHKRMIAAKMAGLLAALASVITFFLTEDVSLPMAMNDRYTGLMLIIFAVQVASAVFNKKASMLGSIKEEATEGGVN